MLFVTSDISHGMNCLCLFSTRQILKYIDFLSEAKQNVLQHQEVIKRLTLQLQSKEQEIQHIQGN